MKFLLLILLLPSVVCAQISGTGTFTGTGFITTVNTPHSSGTIALGDPPLASTCGSLYKGIYALGFYGDMLAAGCSDEVPTTGSHAAHALSLANTIGPLNSSGSTCSGSPPTCAIGVLGIGMSVGMYSMDGLILKDSSAGAHVSIQNGAKTSNDQNMWIGGTVNIAPPVCLEINCVSLGITNNPNQNEYDLICGGGRSFTLNCNQVETLLTGFNTNSGGLDPTNLDGCFGCLITSAVYSSPSITYGVTSALAAEVTTKDTCTVTGASPSGFNVTNASITAVSAVTNTITVAASNPGSSYVSGGTIECGISIQIPASGAAVALTGTTETVTGFTITPAGSGSIAFSKLVTVGDSLTIKGSSTGACNVVNQTVTVVNTSTNVVTIANASGASACAGSGIYVNDLTSQSYSGLFTYIMPYYLLCNLLDSTSASNNSPIYTQAYNLEWEMGQELRAARGYMPNLLLAFEVGRTYIGYCTSGCADGGYPYDYEQTLAIKRLIQAQVAQEAGGAIDTLAGDLCPPTVTCTHGTTGAAPLILWADAQVDASNSGTIKSAFGWSPGTNIGSGTGLRGEDGFGWCSLTGGSGLTSYCQALSAPSGTNNGDYLFTSPFYVHPCCFNASPSINLGSQRWGVMMDAFLDNDAYARPWYTQ